MESYRIAVLWRGDRDARKAATPQNNRYYRIFEELGALGMKRGGADAPWNMQWQTIAEGKAKDAAE